MSIFWRLLGFLRPYRAGAAWSLVLAALAMVATVAIPWLTGQAIMMDGGNALATGGSFYELRDWSDNDWQAARERIEAQNAKDKAQR